MVTEPTANAVSGLVDELWTFDDIGNYRVSESVLEIRLQILSALERAGFRQGELDDRHRNVINRCDTVRNRARGDLDLQGLPVHLAAILGRFERCRHTVVRRGKSSALVDPGHRVRTQRGRHEGMVSRSTLPVREDERCITGHNMSI